MDAVNTLISSMAGWPRVLPIVFALVVVDGFFPPVPSESVLVALAAIGVATGSPDPWLLLLVAATGSFVGDNIAFQIGRALGTARIRALQGKRTTALVSRAKVSLERSPGQ